MKDMDSYLENMNKILDNNAHIFGQVYMITNKDNGMKYIGQTLSHRLNHKKYRPFGYIQRFSQHLSEAKCDNNKTNYLKTSMRRDGSDNFEVSLITNCAKTDVDKFEQYYIILHNTTYPNGYNSTSGGNKGTNKLHTNKEKNDSFQFIKQYRNHQTMETKQKISLAVKEFLSKPEETIKLSSRVQTQHMETRLHKFNNVKLQFTNDLDQYIKKKKNGDKICYIININNIKTSFFGKQLEEESIKQRAYNFIKSLM